jgi:hypothetical protein
MIFAFAPLRAMACVACAVLTFAAHAAPDSEFREAVASYRAARYSEAFGKLMGLANRGDSDAARMVLFMHQYGPTLYGSYWDLNPDEILMFQQVAQLARQRAQPVFQPTSEPVRVSTQKPRTFAPKERKP